MANIRIVTDSACDLTSDELSQHGIEVVPLTIRFGDDEYTDGRDLSPQQFYDLMASSSALPETAAPAPGAFEQAFKKVAGEGASTVMCINLSAALSATMQSAQSAAKALDGEIDVRVIDSRSITAGLGIMVTEAAKAAEAGRSADEIAALVDDLSSRVHVFGGLDTLDNLRKGGRIGGAQAMLGSMLSIKPVIDISTGKVEEAAKPRTRKKALQWIRDKTLSFGDITHLNVVSGLAPDQQDLADMLMPPFRATDIRQGVIGPVIGAHGGPRVIGTAFIAPR